MNVESEILQVLSDQDFAFPDFLGYITFKVI